MTLLAPTIDTTRVDPGRRLDYWRDMISSTFVSLDCDVPAQLDFNGTLSSSSLEDVRLSKVVSNAQRVSRSLQRIRQSPDDCFLVSIQLSGQGSVIQSDRCALLRPGDFSLYDTAHPYELRFEHSFEQLVLRIPRPQLSRRMASPERLTAISYSAIQPGVGAVLSDFACSVFKQSQHLDRDSRHVLHQTLIDLLVWGLGTGAATACEASTSRQALRQRIKYFVDAHLDDSSLDCQAIAAAHGISSRYLNKIFAADEGSITEWMWSRRLEKAKSAVELAARSGRSLTQIAYDCGFKDPAHFSRAFKSRFGLSPTAWRQRVLQQTSDWATPDK